MATEIPGLAIDISSSVGFIKPDVVLDWVAIETALRWRFSKSSGTAVIIHPSVAAPDYCGGAIMPVPSHMTAEEWYRFRLDTQIAENGRRDRATPEVCGLVLMAYIEGRDLYARKLGKAMGSDMAATELARSSLPSYTEMRNFLIGELDACPITAAAAAFRQREFHNKLNRRELAAYFGDPPPELGWL